MIRGAASPRRWFLALLAGSACLALALPGAHPPSHLDAAPPVGTERALRFDADVLPILQAHCVRCHGEKTRRASLDLSSAAGVAKGGENGPVVVAGKVEESRLYELVHGGEMPPNKKDPLSKAQLDTLRRWIEAGAPGMTVAASTQPAVTQHDIGSLMRLRCAVCHGLRKQEGDLDLRTRASMLKGGKSGPAIVLGKPEESLLLKRVHAGEMPPNKRLLEVSVRPLAREEVERLTKWIALGAPEVTLTPDTATTTPDPLVSDEDRRFWSFQPPQPVVVPRVKASDRVRNPIDAFILARLEEKGLTLAPEADRLTLLRRASFDLTGLPPEPEEVRAFLADDSPDAYEKLLDRLLASPRYGERWARYWLDLAGYADSEGKRSADPVRPNAFYYRDYVIRSLNADKPYDRFLLEQLAGDELADYEKASEITPEIMDNLVATGFLRMAPDGTGSDVVNFVPERMEVIADEMQVLGASVLGLTLHCARCHNHKYDPIPQRDYFRLLDVFKGAYDEHDWLKPSFVPGQTKAKAPGRELPHVTPEIKQAWEERNAKVRQEIEQLKQKPGPQSDRQIRGMEATLTAAPAIRALWDRGEPSPTYVYRRGDYLQPGLLVGPGVPSVLTDGKTPFVVEPPWPGAKQTGRRLALARWLVQPDHPLTARVMVNRLWKHHFGQGIVRSLENFGKTGVPPTHPELLDWLARAFTQTRGASWSLKAMHRLLMTSSTYRQSSQVTAEQERLDPENRLLTRMPLKRMEAEVLYDSLLLVAGRLDPTRFGPPDPVEVRADGLAMAAGGERGWRRSIYVRQRRTQLPTLLETFDLPQMNPNCVERVDSTVASQALHLLNNARVQELAAAFADRVSQSAGNEPPRQVEQAYLIAVNRPPTSEEARLGREMLQQLTAHWTKHLAGTGHSDANEAARKALITYCHTLLNSAAFIYID